MLPRTIFLSRLIGLYCILVIPSMLFDRQATVDTMTALLQNPSMMLFPCIVGVVAGLAMVLTHNIWSGGALPVVVTLVGWLTLVKSLAFLWMPSGPETELIVKGIGHPTIFYVWMAPSLLLGIYLTIGGFRFRPPRLD